MVCSMAFTIISRKINVNLSASILIWDYNVYFTTYNPNKNSGIVNAYAAMCYNVQSIRVCNFIQKYANHDISQYLVLNIQITAVYYVLKIHSILISSHNLKELKHDSLKSNRVFYPNDL